MKGRVRVESIPSIPIWVCPAAAVDAAVVGVTAVAAVVAAADQELTEWDTQSEVLPSRW